MTASGHTPCVSKPEALRCLFVIDSLGSGGAQRQMVTLAKGLKQRGHDIEFFLYHPRHKHFAADLDAALITVHECQKHFRFSPRPMLALRKLIHGSRFDALVAFLPTPSLYAELAGIGIDAPPLAVSERSAFGRATVPPVIRLRQVFHRLAAAVVVNSHHQRQRMEKEFPWMRTKLITIWNGVDLERFAPFMDGSRIAITGRSLLAIGNVRPSKNLLGLAAAVVEYYRAGGQGLRITWVGKVLPTKESAREKTRVDSMLSEARLTNVWDWAGERSDISRLMSEHAAVIHPSLLEGLPNVVCEALACGRPVLASNIGDHPRLIQDELTGFLFDGNRPKEIAASIARFFSLPDERICRMASNARRFAVEQLSAARCCTQYESLLTALVLRRSAIRGRYT